MTQTKAKKFRAGFVKKNGDYRTGRFDLVNRSTWKQTDGTMYKRQGKKRTTNANEYILAHDLDKKAPELTEEIKGALLKRLAEVGEDEDLENWELIDARPSNEYDKQLHNTFNFASAVRSTPNKSSDQDTTIIKVRYVYAGSQAPEREFCRDMVSASRVYRVEDLDSDNPNYNGNAQNVNEGLGIRGADNYNIFLYKGGVNCQHFFERRTYLRKNNKRITVNEARRLIIAIDPNMRDEARIVANPREVAQIAEAQNDYWKYDR